MPFSPITAITGRHLAKPDPNRYVVRHVENGLPVEPIADNQGKGAHATLP